MTGAVAHIFRYPIKGHGWEELANVVLDAGECVPWDRYWAVAHEAAKLTPGWNRCANFARGAKAPQLMAITARLEEETKTITLSHPVQGDITFQPENPSDLPRFLDWVRPLNPPNRAQPRRIVSADRGMTDSDFPSVSILSLASLKDLSDRMGVELSVHRWRSNLWISGAPPWAEFDWIGREIRIGAATLKIEARIERCKATTVNPSTGEIDADTLGALSQNFGHRDFGIYGTVIKGGPLAKGDKWSLL